MSYSCLAARRSTIISMLWRPSCGRRGVESEVWVLGCEFVREMLIDRVCIDQGDCSWRHIVDRREYWRREETRCETCRDCSGNINGVSEYFGKAQRFWESTKSLD